MIMTMFLVRCVGESAWPVRGFWGVRLFPWKWARMGMLGQNACPTGPRCADFDGI